VVVVLCAVLYYMFCGSYRSCCDKDEKLRKQRSQEVELQVNDPPMVMAQVLRWCSHAIVSRVGTYSCLTELCITSTRV